ncbi:DNA polymerase subunit Cdc27 [Kockovaella imperatae]|uniref:DNA polymerase delta subunit 3 n=1 Tax=Kockovaella imperatae TaxID=4999 RepID=A0A1Y1UBW5_9TREE|nr:DNA polymerase subunit Cdc27 [Kockovaella imperatae]ORX35492.1 DNA polymerase subunit Cdc27 [Kockovaella imperatae]
MVTAEQQKLASRKLTHWLESEKRIVTFRELSREVGCHVNGAKNLLLDYFESHPSISPTYLLTGDLLSTSKLATNTLPEDREQVTATQRVRIVDMDEMSDADRNSEDGVGDADGDDPDKMDTDDRMGNDHGDEEGGISGTGTKSGLIKDARDDEAIVSEEVKRWGVVLVHADELDEKKKLFDSETLNIHIYALSPRLVKDPAQYLIPNLALRSHASYFKPEVYGTISGPPLISLDVKPAAKPMKDGAMDFGGGKKESKVDNKPVKEDKKETVKVKTEDKPKPTAQPPTKAKPAPAPATMSQSLKSAKKNKRIITSDNEEEEEPVEEPAAPPASSSFKSVKVETTSSQARAADAAAMEAMMSMDMDFDMEEDEKVEQAQGESSSSKVKESEDKEGKKGRVSGVKRKRRVKRSIQTTDAKGYIITTDHWSETDGSGPDDEDDEESGKSASAISKKTAAASGTSGKNGSNSNMSRGSSTSGDIGSAAPKKSSGAAAPRPPPNKAAGGGSTAKKAGAGGQSTLSGFFKKK